MSGWILCSVKYWSHLRNISNVYKAAVDWTLLTVHLDVDGKSCPGFWQIAFGFQ